MLMISGGKMKTMSERYATQFPLCEIGKYQKDKIGGKMKNREYCVYFYYNRDDELIYVGKSVDVGARWNGHQEEWKKEVEKIGIRTYPDHAAMDIFEHYYIAKNKPIYNSAFLEHGLTSIGIPDTCSTEVLYSVEEFKKKYCCKQMERNIRKMSFEEKVAALGIAIIDTKCVDFFDESILSMDLDKTIFQYKNIMLISNKNIIFAHNSENCGFTTNDYLIALKNIMSNATCCSDGNEKFVRRYSSPLTSKEDTYKALECNFLFQFDSSTSKKLFTSFSGYGRNNQIWIEQTERNMEDLFHIVRLDKEHFIFDLEHYDEIRF